MNTDTDTSKGNVEHIPPAPAGGCFCFDGKFYPVETNVCENFHAEVAHNTSAIITGVANRGDKRKGELLSETKSNVGGKYPSTCACGKFLKDKHATYYHRKNCTLSDVLVMKTKVDITKEIAFDIGNMRLNNIERSFKNDWLARFGTLDNFPLK